MPDTVAVLFANEAFYRAFADRDMDLMRESWAQEGTITCIHPGWPALMGREAVLMSWERILANPESPPVTCRSAEAFVRGDSAVVICYEEVAETYLVATNLFVREQNRWRMIHHQAGPSPGLPASEDLEPEPPPRVN